MKKLLPFFLFNFLFTLIVLVVICLFFYEKNRIAYVDNTLLFSEFTMAKEVQKEGVVRLKYQQQKLDSLYANMGAKDSAFSKAKRQLLSRELDKFQKMKNQYTNESIQQVWDRLNNYIKLYGEKKGYKIILGAQGTGNIMYADKKLDITDEVLEFVNQKYAGN